MDWFLGFVSEYIGFFILCLLFPAFSFVVTWIFNFFLGFRYSIYFSLLGICVSFVSTVLLFLSLLSVNDYFVFFDYFEWFSFFYGFFSVTFSFHIDALSVTMLFVITTISFLVHLYSLEYLKYDRNLVLFMSYLNLFSFFMILLVVSGNLALLFLGWEGVGFSSYLLINFWYSRLEANKSAVKAIAINRVGDIALLIFLVLCFGFLGTIDSCLVNTLIVDLVDFRFYLFRWDFLFIDVISLFLLVAAVAKSAQFGLHTWLPDAMEGPTPVSALLHAATMVTAGVYLLGRFSSFLSVSVFSGNVCVVIGSLTALFGATVALFQYDLKKIIAFSTCSQLGYMFVCCGLSGYNIALFHLFTHAFFKALLFLSAGVIIHGLNNEQDIRRMGGLIYRMPIAYQFFLAGLLSLVGFPFSSGYYSKDLIIEYAYGIGAYTSFFAFLVLLLSAFFTVLYSVRLLYYVFFVVPSSSTYSNYNSVVDVSIYLFVIMVTLFLGALFSGFLGYDFFLGPGTNVWNLCFGLTDNVVTTSFEYFSINIKQLPLVVIIFGTSLFLLYLADSKMYISGLLFICMVYNSFSFSFFYFIAFVVIYCSLEYLFKSFSFDSLRVLLFHFFSKKWLFDILYNKYVCSFTFFFSLFCYNNLDKGFYEYVGPYGTFMRFKGIINKLDVIYSSDVSYYLEFMFFSLFLIFCFFFFVCF